MDKLYLKFVIAIDMWRHEDQLETFLFEELACRENISETIELLSIIEEAATEFENFFNKQNRDLYREAEKCFGLNDVASVFWEYCHKIIRSSFIGSPELQKILMLRAKVFQDNGFLENAINDYEVSAYICQQNNDFYLDELSYLIECYYFAREIKKFEQSVNLFRKEYSKELKRNKRMQKKNKNRLFLIKQYAEKIKKFEHLQKDLENKLHSNYLGEGNDEKKYMPYQGFKGSLDERISSASVACTFISKCGENKIVANRHIPMGEVIAFEKPLDREYYTPTLQCEHCFKLTTILYTCFNCHQKYYCQLQCLKDDFNIHQYECWGLRNGLLYSMEAAMLFRLFVKSLSYIKTYIFCNFRKAPDINDFFELVMDHIKFGPQARIKKLFTNFDNYRTVEDDEIYSMATCALRLAVYAVEKTSIVEDFFLNVQFEKHKIMIFVASLLCRLQNQIKINSVEMGYIVVHPENFQNIEVKPYQSEIFHSNFHRTNDFRTLFEYCNYSKKEALEEAKQLISTYSNEGIIKTSTVRSTNIQLPVNVTRKFMNQTYADNVGNAEHEFTLNEKSSIAYHGTKQILHLRMHTYNTNLSDNTTALTMQGVYPVITKFRHSCESNAVPILLESGSLLIKANKEICQGEEITISYIADYKCHTNYARKQLQAYLKFHCNCKFCVDDIDYWEVNNAVYCYICHNVIVGSRCATCNIDKQRVKAIYEDICKSVQNTANRRVADEVESLKYLILLHQLQTLMYTESHQNIFISKFHFASICVQKNFVYDAFGLIQNIFYQIPIVLGEWNSQHLGYLSMTLDKLICLLNGNIIYNKSFVQFNLDLFYDIWSLANNVAKKLIFQHDFLEMFNFTTCNILTQYQLLIQLKRILFDYEYENLKKPVVDNDDIYELPKLSPDLNEISSVEESFKNKEYNKKCPSDSNSEEISFFAEEEDLVSIPSVATLVGNKEAINKKSCYNFISPDMTGNDIVVQDADLREIIEDNLTSQEESRT